MEYDFGWSDQLARIPSGSRISLERFFAICAEAEPEDVNELLEQYGIGLDVSRVPVTSQGEAAVRLQTEHSLARQGRLPQGLEVDDPLRSFWNELKGFPRQETVADADSVGYLWLTLEEAPTFAGQGVFLLDLLQEGAMGLIRRLGEGDCTLEDLRWSVREAMARTVAWQYLETGEGERVVASMRAYQQADRRLLRTLGRNPGPEELAQELGKTVSEVEEIRRMVQSAIAVPKQRQTPQEEPQEQEAVEDSAYFQLRTRVEELLSRLEPLDRQLVSLRFGLEGHKPQSVEEAAQSLEIPVEEAQRRELEAMRLLRN